MVKKILGYVLCLAGLATIALSFPAIKTLTKLPIPAIITDTYLMIAGVILLIVGAVLAFGRRGIKQSAEVPIFRGNQVVGYRQTR